MLMMDPADREDFDQHAELLTWEILPMYFCAKCGVNARVSPGNGPRQKWACHVCLNVTTDLMRFERIGPVAQATMGTDQELTKAAERLASNVWDTYIDPHTPDDPANRDWRLILDAMMNDYRLLARHYLAANPTDEQQVAELDARYVCTWIVQASQAGREFPQNIVELAQRADRLDAAIDNLN